MCAYMYVRARVCVCARARAIAQVVFVVACHVEQHPCSILYVSGYRAGLHVAYSVYLAGSSNELVSPHG